MVSNFYTKFIFNEDEPLTVQWRLKCFYISKSMICSRMATTFKFSFFLVNVLCTVGNLLIAISESLKDIWTIPSAILVKKNGTANCIGNTTYILTVQSAEY